MKELENTRALLRRIDGKWTISILAELARAGHAGLGYCRLLSAINAGSQDGVLSTQQLSKALKTLTDRGLIASRGPEREYLLTDPGRDLVALLRALDAACAQLSAQSAARAQPPERVEARRRWLDEGFGNAGLVAA